MLRSTPSSSRWKNIRHSLVVYFVFLSLSVSLDGGSAFLVNITYVHSAISEGAVCLDGSPPAYHLDKGFGRGDRNWLIQIEGGGWCNNVSNCLQRSKTRLGSSKYMVKQLAFSAILSNKRQFNPIFYDWNRVKVRYCDGASFTGNVQEVDPVAHLYFRGARIFDALVKYLLSIGMKNAQNAILSGCSAGGLAAILHCDRFRSLLPVHTNVTCISDAGYFVNVNDLTHQPHIEQFFDQVANLHGSVNNLPLSCTAIMKPGLCFFPENMVTNIKTPLFVLNAAYDSWQVKNILAPGSADRHGLWRKCKMDVDNCNLTQIGIMQGFRSEFLQKFSPVHNASANGYFINSCYAHCQSEQQIFWLMEHSPRLANTTIARAIADWHMGYLVNLVDCPYPCDTTCVNHVYQ